MSVASFSGISGIDLYRMSSSGRWRIAKDFSVLTGFGKLDVKIFFRISVLRLGIEIVSCNVAD